MARVRRIDNTVNAFLTYPGFINDKGVQTQFFWDISRLSVFPIAWHCTFLQQCFLITAGFYLCLSLSVNQPKYSATYFGINIPIQIYQHYQRLLSTRNYFCLSSFWPTSFDFDSLLSPDVMRGCTTVWELSTGLKNKQVQLNGRGLCSESIW